LFFIDIIEMSDVLPKIIEPILTEDTETTDEVKLEINDEDVNEDTNVNEITSPPVIEKKPKIEQSEIFNDPPQVKPVVKKKRKMSEKQLENLKKAREKSNQLRAERKAKAEAEAKEIISQKKQELVNKKVEKALKKQETILEKEQVIVNNKSITEEDIQKIVSQSILQYDTDRKKIKEAKKKKKAEDEEKSRINNTIRKAQGLPKALTPQDAGYFNNCFG
jgi:hypothetical protein